MEVSHAQKPKLFFFSYHETRHEKPHFLQRRKQRCRSAARFYQYQRLCFRYIDSTSPLLPKSRRFCSSHFLWLDTPKTGILMTWLNDPTVKASRCFRSRTRSGWNITGASPYKNKTQVCTYHIEKMGKPGGGIKLKKVIISP